MPLSPKARRAAAEYEQAIHDGNAQHVLGLVDSYGLSSGDRIAVVEELDRKQPDYSNVEFGYSKKSDQAYVRDLPAVWQEAAS